MRKRMIRGLVVGSVAVLAMTVSAADAAVGVHITTPNDSTLFTLPAPQFNLSYPPEISRDISGTASFDSANASVLYQFVTAARDNSPIVAYSGDTAPTCPEVGPFSCTWSFSVPFFLPPGDYRVDVTASQPAADGVSPAETSTESINVHIL